MPLFENNDIIIAHRSKINIYFSSEAEAKKVNFTQYTKEDMNSFGNING